MVAFVFLCSTRPVEGQVRGVARAPVVSAEVVRSELIDEGAALGVRIAVTVPTGHHGYVDRGDDGFYIPFSFGFPALLEAGGATTELERPTGVRDEAVRAHVLRERAEFEYELGPVAALRSLEELRATLRYQVCNDRTGICYPPRTVVVVVPLPS